MEGMTENVSLSVKNCEFSVLQQFLQCSDSHHHPSFSLHKTVTEAASWKRERKRSGRNKLKDRNPRSNDTGQQKMLKVHKKWNFPNRSAYYKHPFLKLTKDANNSSLFDPINTSSLCFILHKKQKPSQVGLWRSW